MNPGSCWKWLTENLSEMKLENQVSSKEQSKKLKELGVIQKSLFYWHPNFDRPVFGEKVTTKSGSQYKKTQVCNDKNVATSAFTVAELGLIMKEYSLPFYWKIWDGWCYKQGGDPKGFDNEVTARAEMLIYLLESKRLKAEEIILK